MGDSAMITETSAFPLVLTMAAVSWSSGKPGILQEGIHLSIVENLASILLPLAHLPFLHIMMWFTPGVLFTKAGSWKWHR